MMMGVKEGNAVVRKRDTVSYHVNQALSSSPGASGMTSLQYLSTTLDDIVVVLGFPLNEEVVGWSENNLY